MSPFSSPSASRKRTQVTARSALDMHRSPGSSSGSPRKSDRLALKRRARARNTKSAKELKRLFQGPSSSETGAVSAPPAYGMIIIILNVLLCALMFSLRFSDFGCWE